MLFIFPTCTGWTRVLGSDWAGKHTRPFCSALEDSRVLHRAFWGPQAKLWGKALLRALDCLLAGCNALFPCGVHLSSATAQNPMRYSEMVVNMPATSTTSRGYSCKSFPFGRRHSMNWARWAPSDENRKWQQAHVQLKKMHSKEVPVPYSSAYMGAGSLGNASVTALHECNQSTTAVSTAFCCLS